MGRAAAAFMHACRRDNGAVYSRLAQRADVPALVARKKMVTRGV